MLAGIHLWVHEPFKAPRLPQPERAFAMPSVIFTAMGELGEFVATFGKSESFVVMLGVI